MHRKHHKIKREMPESSSSLFKDNEEHDLAYYIHDRVELVHQVFSVIKPKELKAMVPQCVQHISIDDLQELCTEELLGISSKRLCAILDGADPPTDTESSASEQLETISLDSISSDDEILSQHSSKSRKHKHRKHKSKSKHKSKNGNSKSKSDEDVEDRSKASRAGLTVLELLELQARARAIRAQLQQDNNINKQLEPTSTITTQKEESSDEVEIKEEPAEVVEISSEDEKPDIKDLPVSVNPTRKKDDSNPAPSSTVKRVNNLIITVPQSTCTKKIKLKRNRTITTSATEKGENISTDVNSTPISIKTKNLSEEQNANNDKTEPEKIKSVLKTKKKIKKKSKSLKKVGSDEDEITLQLSDTEKMDLLENFDRKNYDNLTSSSSKDSESSSHSSSGSDSEDVNEVNTNDISIKESNENYEKVSKLLDVTNNDKENISFKNDNLETSQSTDGITSKNTGEDVINNEKNIKLDKNIELAQPKEGNNSTQNQDVTVSLDEVNLKQKIDVNNINKSNNERDLENDIVVNITDKNKDLSEGEISENESAENESRETLADIVCISDGEKTSKTKMNKEKEKKSKKTKKTKKNSKYIENNLKNNESTELKTNSKDIELKSESKMDQSSSMVIINDDDNDDIYEILELSDDDSDPEEVSVLSKNPTSAEIIALSVKIDNIHNEDINVASENNTSNIEADNFEGENISWKDRYLGSKKVKKVLSTANILNALRKKNKELKKKIQESKHVSETLPIVNSQSKPNDLEEGSIEHFNTLQGSSKYVDPVVVENVDKSTEADNNVVTKEMEKDAKLLLKMYKKLLKYNDIKKQKDPNKKKKKKQKKSKDRDKEKHIGSAET